jgi:hypothetical protein
MSCHKTAFRDKADALVHASLSLRYNDCGTDQLRIYRCSECRRWHMTKQKQWVRTILRREVGLGKKGRTR